MNYILLIISMLSMVCHNGVLNSVSKQFLKGKADTMRYNAWMYLVCIVLFGIGALGKSISYYSVLLGILFGAVTMISNYFCTRALSKGPMHITILITASSMIIPALSGVVMFGEKFRLAKFLMVISLIIFLYISLEKSEDAKIKKMWFLYTALAFVFQGLLGIVQKIHQSSEYKNEIFIFLASAFLVSFILSGVFAGRNVKMAGKQYVFGVISGFCIFIMNLFNLYLSGVMSSQILFPLVDGGAILLSSLVSVFIFKESLTKRQAVGLAGGLLSLILICIL